MPSRNVELVLTPTVRPLPTTMSKEKPGNTEMDEPPMTIDTPGPMAVAPPAELLAQAAIETGEVAVLVPHHPHEEHHVAASALPPQDAATDISNITPISTHVVSSDRVCTVIAPATLDAGYSFPAQVDGIDFVIVVPHGGVAKGQKFTVPYPKPRETTIASSETCTRTAAIAVTTTATTPGGMQPLSIEMQSPNHPNVDRRAKGHWKHELCECCETCCTSGMCWQGWFCTAVLLAQIMTRLKLNICGVPSPPHSDGYEATIWCISISWFVVLLLSCGLLAVDVATAFSILLIWIICISIVGANVRSNMRRRYNVEADCWPACDGVMEDFCCSLWCCCCTSIQMARETHDEKAYPYHCCTATGLSADAPEIA